MRIILFASLAATELMLPGENTFRQGTKWSDLKPGEKVGLALTAEPERIIDTAVVRGVVLDHLGVLLNVHAGHNHAVLKACGDNEIRWDQAADSLLASLRAIYPGMTDTDLFTVVYLQRGRTLGMDADDMAAKIARQDAA